MFVEEIVIIKIQYKIEIVNAFNSVKDNNNICKI